MVLLAVAVCPVGSQEQLVGSPEQLGLPARLLRVVGPPGLSLRIQASMRSSVKCLHAWP